MPWQLVPPDPELLNQKPYGKEHNFVDPSGPLPKHIIGQAVYQLGVLAWLLGPAPDVLGISHHISGNGPSVHHTLVFNTFVMMQLFNQLNARLINDSDGLLDNIQGETLFLWVLCSEFLLQFVIVQYGAMFFNTTGPADRALARVPRLRSGEPRSSRPDRFKFNPVNSPEILRAR